jgi:hypothetical protein
MNETMSLLLVATVLAVGGAGLYLYKSDDDTVEDIDNESADSYNEVDEEFKEPKVRSKISKTKRNKARGGTKRRY